MGSLDEVTVVVVRLAIGDEFPEPVANFAVNYHLRGIGLWLVPDML